MIIDFSLFIFPVFVQDGRYRPYTFNDCVWSTPHNTDHGYIREITAIGATGKEKIVNTVNFLVTCSYIVTL